MVLSIKLIFHDMITLMRPPSSELRFIRARRDPAMAPHVFIRDGSHSNPVLRPVDIDNMSYDALLDLERQLGQVRSPGASMEQISELPAFAYHRAPDDKKQSSAAPKSCAICMEELKEGEQVRSLPCFHIFHAEEIDKWLQTNSSCPICKTPLIAQR